MLGEKQLPLLQLKKKKKKTFRLAYNPCRIHQVSSLWSSNKTIFEAEMYFDWLCFYVLPFPHSFCLQFIVHQRSHNKFNYRL